MNKNNNRLNHRLFSSLLFSSIQINKKKEKKKKTTNLNIIEFKINSYFHNIRNDNNLYD